MSPGLAYSDAGTLAPFPFHPCHDSNQTVYRLRLITIRAPAGREEAPGRQGSGQGIFPVESAGGEASVGNDGKGGREGREIDKCRRATRPRSLLFPAKFSISPLNVSARTKGSSGE